MSLRLGTESRKGEKEKEYSRKNRKNILESKEQEEKKNVMRILSGINSECRIKFDHIQTITNRRYYYTKIFI